MLLSMSTATLPSAWASCEDDLGQAERMLQGCDAALKACAKSLGSCNELAEAQKKVLAEQGTEIDRLQRANSGILNSPVFWFVTGIAVGAVVVSTVHR